MFNNIFIFGNEYIDYLEKEKEERVLVWYEKLYIWYYNHFEYIIVISGLLLLGCIFYFEFYKKQNTITFKNKQIGGTETQPLKILVASSENSTESNTNTNISATTTPAATGNAATPGADGQEQGNQTQGQGQGEGNNGKGDGKGDVKREKGKGNKLDSIKKGSKSFGKVNKGLSKLNKGIGNAGTATKDLMLSNMGDFYKFFFTIFITFALGVFIMPTLVLAVIGFLTFLITKKHITKTFTL